MLVPIGFALTILYVPFHSFLALAVAAVLAHSHWNIICAHDAKVPTLFPKNEFLVRLHTVWWKNIFWQLCMRCWQPLLNSQTTWSHECVCGALFDAATSRQRVQSKLYADWWGTATVFSSYIRMRVCALALKLDISSHPQQKRRQQWQQ